MKPTRTILQRITFSVIAAAVLLFGTGPASADPAKSESNKRPYTTDFGIDDCTFVNDDTGLNGNPLWYTDPHRFSDALG
jgi:hypothetical protein